MFLLLFKCQIDSHFDTRIGFGDDIGDFRLCMHFSGLTSTKAIVWFCLCIGSD